MIVATAGHVDHGKTSLVKALTGVDTDRLPEEKRRGMTIDLGFAYSGALGFVDVPGHERFVHNMLAGVAGIDFALLVIAADDGPMPQTHEHLAILDLLGIARGAVALTKIDRVASGRVHDVAAEVRDLIASTTLANAAIFPLSSSTGAGIEALRQHLDEAGHATALRKAAGHFRLSVDRSFTIAGAGLVVTGTALSGEVAVGDDVRVLLESVPARVRSIHAHNAAANRGRAGERLALNLAGLNAAAVARGDWIVRGNVPPAVARIDARLRNVCGNVLKHWTPVHVHVGAADVTGRIAVLEGDTIPAGASALVQLVLDRRIGALAGDGFIVRDQSSRRTLGGGRVVDVFPPPRGRAKPERLAELAAIELLDDAAALGALLERRPLGVDLAHFAANRNLRELPPVEMRTAAGVGFAPEMWKALKKRAIDTVAAWHARTPDSLGPAEDRILDGARLPREIVLAVSEELVRDGALVREALGVRLPTHRVEMSAADSAAWNRIEALLTDSALRPPTLAEIAGALAIDVRKIETVLSRASRQGLAVRVSKNRFFLPAPLKTLERMAQDLALSAAPLTAATFRDRSGIGRNLAIEVLEYFDRIKFTRRVGDARVLIHGRDSHPGGAHGLQIR